MRRQTHSQGTRGFSLVELLIALVLGSFSVVVAAEVAGMATRQSGRGEQVTALSQSTRLIGRQIRTDIKLAGYGSTGAIGVDPGVQPWAAMQVATFGGFNAIPAVRGADNLPGGAIGGVAILPGSDAIQIVVPNPATMTRTTIAIPRTTPLCPGVPCAAGLPLVPLPVAGCALMFISDHSGATGAGKTQVFAPGNTMQFDAAPGSELMCARISTYFVDTNNNLRRVDLAPNVAPGVAAGASGTRVFNNSALSGVADVVTPGVLDLQFAYQASSEVYVNPVVAPAARWAFDGAGNALDGLIAGPERNWFEVREVRLNVLVRTLRAVDNVRDTEPRTEAVLENSAVVIPPRDLAVAFGRSRLTTSELLTNVKLFDLNVSRGAPAEPFLRY
ncbi:MAG: prepilin-type N-terminal cleavage/methylation domain-containing protein [Deltaproteobacteria bacterium]|nr:prepilin-type N-terminal cleavage/methylation domain-containing protein [Deltaproteobacteria bacterium]